MIKEKVFNLVQKGSHGSRTNLVFDYTIMILILLNVIAIIIESIHEISISFGHSLKIFEIASVGIFSLEYLMRLYVSDLTHPTNNRIKSALKFIFSAYGLVDLLAVIPFYLPFLIKIDLRFLRLLRLIRFLRILKINRYNSSINLIWTVIKEKKNELLITGFITLLILLIASILMYFIEGPEQPEQFPNILASFWWAIATLTTVGYGDVYPITGFGKFVSGIIAILGIGIVALPTGLVSAGFMNKLDKKNKKSTVCPHCGEEIEE
jgi:voltage-gated potassium channel